MSDEQNKMNGTRHAEESGKAPDILKEAFEVFSNASRQLENSYNELKVKADRLAKELAQTNEELQRQLAEKERIGNFLSNILQSIRSGIIAVAPDGTVSLTNQLACDMLGIEDDPAGLPFDELFGDSPSGLFLRECMDDPDHSPRTAETEAGNGSRKVYSLTFAPVIDRAERETAFLLVLQDVTRLKLLEEQAVRTNRLAAMGEMAAQLAHEIRNPLGSIEIFASLLSRDLKDDPNGRLADNIVVGVKSLNAVVTNMLTFTRSISINFERLDFNSLVAETLGFLDQMLKVQGIKLRTELSDTIGEAHVDPELFKQIVLNLAQNSIQAMDGADPAVLTVRTDAVRDENGEPAVEMQIADTGCGIPREELRKIFDPFYSTRKGGTGLGLSVVSQIVEKHGGLIVAESTVGQGTIMRMTLPLNQP